MQAKSGPSRMSIPIGQTVTHMCRPRSRRHLPRLRSSIAFWQRCAVRPIVAVVDGTGLRIPDSSLEAGPRTHEGADLVPCEAVSP